MDGRASRVKRVGLKINQAACDPSVRILIAEDLVPDETIFVNLLACCKDLLAVRDLEYDFGVKTRFLAKVGIISCVVCHCA